MKTYIAEGQIWARLFKCVGHFSCYSFFYQSNDELTLSCSKKCCVIWWWLISYNTKTKDLSPTSIASDCFRLLRFLFRQSVYICYVGILLVICSHDFRLCVYIHEIESVGPRNIIFTRYFARQQIAHNDVNSVWYLVCLDCESYLTRAIDTKYTVNLTFRAIELKTK